MDYDLIQVSELNALETPSNTDVLPVQNGSELKKITFQNLKSAATGDKLNKPTGGNGTPGQMLLTNGDGSTQWGSPDDTLATTGKAADAKATGDAIKAVDANLAAPYSTSATYAVGDYCTKDGVLKRCNTAITTAEAWNSDHWDDAKLGGDVSDLKNALINNTANHEIQFSDPTLRQYIKTNADPVSWATPSVSSGTNIKWAVVECKEGDAFIINGTGGSSDRLWAFLDSSKNRVAYSAASVTLENTILIAPKDSAYLVINDETNKKSFVGEYVIDKLASDEITSAESTGTYKINGKDTTWENRLLAADGTTPSNTYNVLSDFIAVDRNSSVVFTGAEKVGNVSYAVYVGEYYDNHSSAFLRRVPLYTTSADKNKFIKLSNLTKYIRIMYGHANATLQAYTTQEPELFSCRVVKSGDESAFQSNMFESLMRTLNTKWTALSNVPKITGGEYFPVGDVYGIPYSSAKEYDKFVGYNVMPVTFLSATKNPYSLLYTEDINGARSTSEYGITYHGKNCGSYFGVVCNTLVLPAVGFDIIWNTDEFEGLYKFGILKQNPDQSAYGLQAGDIIWQTGHTRIVTDVLPSGNDLVIKYVEATSPLPRVGEYSSASVFENWVMSNNAVVYRVGEFMDNTQRIDFSNYIYNADVCTFAGDYASFYKGEEIWINYNLGSTAYTGLNVYKGDTLVSSYELPSGHKISVGSDFAEGLYTVVLTGNGVTSQPTHFEVVDVTTEVLTDGNELTVNFSSKNGAPLYLQLCYQDGTSRGIKKFTNDEVTIGQCVFDAVKLKNYFYSGYQFTEDVYVKVFFRGRYGIVRNMVLTNLS